MEEKDERLERLYDYTKWHLGIYITGAGVLIALAGSSAGLSLFTDSPYRKVLLIGAILLMGAAGIAGGTIVSACTKVQKFGDVWDEKLPKELKWMRGSILARIEHVSFWLSIIILFIAAVPSLVAQHESVRYDCDGLKDHLLTLPSDAQAAAAVYQALGCPPGS